MSESQKVSKEQVMRYIEMEKEIQKLEAESVVKNYEVRKKAADDVAETIRAVEIQLQQLVLDTEREKVEYQNILSGSIKEIFEEQDYKKRMTKEQEEYLEAKNKEELARQQLDSLKKQREDLQKKADEIKGPAEKLTKLYEERDNLLSDIFGGEYGSEMENKLEAMFDALMDKKQRISVAHYKWTSARVLLQHAVKQMAYAVQKWKELDQIPPQQQQMRYTVATEARNNNVAAIQNIRSCARYLGDKIEFPYCKEDEMLTLERATQNIYIDMMDKTRHHHAGQCYDITMRRAAALLQWFDTVIQGTIQRDLLQATEEARKVEKDLRAERIRLIRDKVKESGGDVNFLNDSGLKGLTDGFSSVDQKKLTDDDMDMKGIGITKPEPVGDDKGLSENDKDEPMPPAPTPLPLSELAPMPSETDLFGDISEIKERYKRDTEEFNKAQQMNKARMEQGLQAKLAQRRHKKQ